MSGHYLTTVGDPGALGPKRSPRRLGDFSSGTRWRFASRRVQDHFRDYEDRQDGHNHKDS